jgi:cytochrome P450
MITPRYRSDMSDQASQPDDCRGSGSPVRPVVDFDPFSDAYSPARAAEVNRRLRELPVSFSTHHGGFWTMARHADVVEGFRQDGKKLSAIRRVAADGSVSGGSVLPPLPSGLGFLEQDPPIYPPIRQALNPWFTAAASAERRPRLGELASALLDQHIESGRVDMLDDLIRPLAGIATLELLGLPLEGLSRFAFPLQESTHDFTKPDTYGRVWDRVKHDIGCEFAARRAAGRTGTDLIEVLRSLEVLGEPLADDFLVECVLLLLVGGVETVAGAFAGALFHLDSHPEHRRRLIDDPSLLPTAFEEYVRYVTPTTQNTRTAVCDLDLAGQRIAEGDVVYFNLFAANHDEREFDRPEDVVLDRSPNRHLGFGTGLHRCIGAHLAREMWVAAMAQVLSRVPDFVIDTERVEWFAVCGTSNGCKSMPATFRPASRRPASEAVRRQVEAAQRSRGR